MFNNSFDNLGSKKINETLNFYYSGIHKFIKLFSFFLVAGPVHLVCTAATAAARSNTTVRAATTTWENTIELKESRKFTIPKVLR